MVMLEKWSGTFSVTKRSVAVAEVAAMVLLRTSLVDKEVAVAMLAVAVTKLAVAYCGLLPTMKVLRSPTECV